MTKDEQAEPRLLLGQSGSVAVAGVQPEVAAFMPPLFDDGEGYKGRPRPTQRTGGGGPVPDYQAVMQRLGDGRTMEVSEGAGFERGRRRP